MTEYRLISKAFLTQIRVAVGSGTITDFKATESVWTKSAHFSMKVLPTTLDAGKSSKCNCAEHFSMHEKSSKFLAAKGRCIDSPVLVVTE